MYLLVTAGSFGFAVSAGAGVTVALLAVTSVDCATTDCAASIAGAKTEAASARVIIRGDFIVFSLYFLLELRANSVITD
jgi:hypothetical protein